MGTMAKSSVVATVFLLLASVAESASWLSEINDSIIDQKAQTQYSVDSTSLYLGNVSIRKKFKRHSLATLQAPRMNVGCGGIDAFLGGMKTVIDSKWVKSRAEAIIQASGYAAFEIALKVYCPTCLETMRDIQAVVDRINAISLDECAAGKAAVAYAANKISENQKAQTEYGRAMQKSGLTDFWGEAKPNIESKTDMKDTKKGCAGIVQDMQSQPYSLLNVAGKNMGMNKTSIYITRGLIGDIKYDPSTGILYYAEYCSENEAVSSPEILEGEIYQKTDDGSCKKTSINIKESMATEMLAILNAIKTQSSVSASNLTLLANKGINFQQAAKFGLIARMSNDYFEELIDIAGTGIVLSVLTEATALIGNAERQLWEDSYRREQKVKCFANIVASEMEKGFQPMKERAKNFQSMISDEYLKLEEEFGKKLTTAKTIADIRERQNREKARQMINNVVHSNN